MQSKTMQQIITDVERMIYQSAGAGVQIYSQDLLLQKVNQGFIRCFEAEYWPEFTTRLTRTLNGTTGEPTVPFDRITNWHDVKAVFRYGSQHPIPVMPDSYNALHIPAGHARFLQPTADETLFTMYPVDATDEISVVGRVRPVRAGDFLITDAVPFDWLALEYATAWEYALDDASNAAMAQKFQGLFDARIQQLRDNSFHNVIPLAPNSSSIPLDWR